MAIVKPIHIPHPFPYQGGKRGIAKFILPYFPFDVQSLVEPFCGASAVSISAAAHGFNPSADNRRSGMRPNAMRQNILGVSAPLENKTTISAVDFRQAVETATTSDLICMDPPYQETSLTRDRRYLNGLPYEGFSTALAHMNERNHSYIISYDGITGEKTHGRLLPSSLHLKHLHIHAGRSALSLRKVQRSLPPRRWPRH